MADDEDLPRDPRELSYDVVNYVDLDDLEGLDEAGLRAHFGRVAAKATGAQLRAFLHGLAAGGSDDDGDKGGLERAFVDRRTSTVLGLRKARGGLRLPFDD